MLHGAQLPLPVLKRWLLAYFCFYHAGTSSWIAGQSDYWTAMKSAAASSEYPRGSERRHFRAALAVSSVEELSKELPEFWDFILAPHPTCYCNPPCIPLWAMMERVSGFRGFGEWIAFKVADVVERMGLYRIPFDDDWTEKFLFKAPRQGADMVVEKYAALKVFPPVTTNVAWSFGYLRRELGDLKAPPRYERPLNAQEFETILCKWKSHLGGHYPVGKDLHEVREGLHWFSRCKLSQRLLRSLPQPV